MTRPKVPGDKRQRTALACDTCKRRKQKCNGLRPCNTCIRKKAECDYTPNPSADNDTELHNAISTRRQSFEDQFQVMSSCLKHSSDSPSFIENPVALNVLPSRFGSYALKQGARRNEISSQKTGGISNDDPEVIGLCGQVRMLQDPRGRLLYFGGSSTLSFLQSMRIVVEDSTGHLPFTADAARHTMTEPLSALHQGVTLPYVLPAKESAELLVRSYFTNTQGIVEVIDRQRLRMTMNTFYTAPSNINPTDLCLIYLVLAIGLLVQEHDTERQEDQLGNDSQPSHLDHAELLFQSAKFVGEPFLGFVDEDFWSVQTLTLMAFYQMMVSRWNAAYGCIGMAVRSAFSLGLHRWRDTRIMFNSQQLTLRQNVWRSLFILDCLISAFMGRPAAISNDISKNGLESPERESGGGDEHTTHVKALNAVVCSCLSVEKTLRRVYGDQKVSTASGQELLMESISRASIFQPHLDSTRLLQEQLPLDEVVAIVHADLIETYSVVLLTRPFFLSFLIKAQNQDVKETQDTSTDDSSLGRLSESCLAASARTISLLYTAYESNYRVFQSPLLVGFLFAATLVVLSNEFASAHEDHQYAASMEVSTRIFERGSSFDTHTRRLYSIVKLFQAVTEDNRRPKSPRRASPPTRSTTPPCLSKSTLDKDVKKTQIPPAGLKRSNTSIALRDAPSESKASMAKTRPYFRVYREA